jgi:hypothetical protein
MSDHFKKFMDDLDRRVQKNRDYQEVSEQERDLQERRRLRQKLYQERWQNRIKWTSK